MCSKRDGFTVIESLIVLSLTTVVLLLVASPIQLMRHPVFAERQFWAAFKADYDQWITKAKTKDHQLMVHVQQDTHQIISDDQTLPPLKIPATLKPQADYAITIHRNGYTKPMTLRRYSTVTHRHIRQTIQLGGGPYLLHEE